MPGSAELAKTDRRQYADPIHLEGKVTQTLYVAPRGKAALRYSRYVLSLSLARR